MYERLYTFLSNNNFIFNLQFGFRQYYSTFDTLFNIIENKEKLLIKGILTVEFL